MYIFIYMYVYICTNIFTPQAVYITIYIYIHRSIYIHPRLFVCMHTYRHSLHLMSAEVHTNIHSWCRPTRPPHQRPHIHNPLRPAVVSIWCRVWFCAWILLLAHGLRGREGAKWDGKVHGIPDDWCWAKYAPRVNDIVHPWLCRIKTHAPNFRT